MLSSRFFWKLYVAFVALILVTAATSLVLVERSVERDAREQIEQALSMRLALLHDVARDHLLDGNYEALRARLPVLGEEVGARLTVIDDLGRVVADSQERAERMDNHLERPEIQAALRDGQGRAERPSATLRTTLIYRARPVRLDERQLGFVRASVPLTHMQARLAHLRTLVLYSSAAGALAAGVVAWFLAQRVTGPVHSMMELARAISLGDYVPRAGSEARDELGELDRALNQMSRELRERMHTIVSDRNKVLAILGSMVEGVVAVDRDDRVVHMNEVAGRLLRASPAESVGKRIWEVTRMVEVSAFLDLARRRAGDVEDEGRLSTGGAEAHI
jgi:two-component system phosphate regulon sensor histidine kinase PhoR